MPIVAGASLTLADAAFVGHHDLHARKEIAERSVHRGLGGSVPIHADARGAVADGDFTLCDKHGPEALYFYAHWRRENPTTLEEVFELLPRVAGKGRFLGVNIGVAADQKLHAKGWWGEGEVKIYLDSDTDLPRLSGSGTEDYAGTGWGQGQYAHRYQGCHVADREKMEYCFHRYHVPDPVYFHKEIRVVIQQIGYLSLESAGAALASKRPLYRAGAGLEPKDPLAAGLFERQDDWSSCAYFYLASPENGLPELAPVEARVAGL